MARPSGHKRSAVVVGAGIAGLTTAIALRQTGWRVTILEKAPALTQVGAGLQISPNGTKVLEHLGVMPYLFDTMFIPPAIEARLGKSGRRFFNLEMGKLAQKRWGAPYFQIHRADLVAGLLARLNTLSGVTLKLGSTVVGYENLPDGVEILLEDGERLQADVLVGADGIHSKIRTQMLGADQPRFTGNVAWRTVVPVAELTHPPPALGCIWTGAGKHVVTTRVSAGQSVNFVGIVEQDDWREEGWSISGSKDQAIADFADWHPSLIDVLQKATVLNRWALFDRAPLSRWSEGRVVILGDAAHPMLPSMAQGAVQAIEDAYVLADILSKTDDISNACATLWTRRIKRTSDVQKLSAKNLHLFHKHSNLAQFASYAPIWAASTFAPSALHRRNDWLYGHDVLNDFGAGNGN